MSLDGVDVRELFAEAESLVISGMRDYDQVRALTEALELFRKNRLLGVVPGLPKSAVHPREEYRQLFDTEIAHISAFTPTCKRYFQVRGFRYLGEAMSFEWGRTFDTIVELRKFASGYGIDRLGPYAPMTEWIPRMRKIRQS